MSKADRWFGPIGGLLFVVSVVVGGIVYQRVNVEPSDSAASVLAQYAEVEASIQIAAFVGLLGLGFLLLFVGDRRTRMREAGAGWEADTVLAAGIALVGAWVALAGVDLAAGVAGESGHAEVAQWATDFSWNGSYLSTPGLLAFGIAAAAASFTKRTLPMWLGVFAVIVGVSSLAPWIGVYIFVAWVLAASVADLFDVGMRRQEAA